MKRRRKNVKKISKNFQKVEILKISKKWEYRRNNIFHEKKKKKNLSKLSKKFSEISISKKNVKMRSQPH